MKTCIIFPAVLSALAFSTALDAAPDQIKMESLSPENFCLVSEQQTIDKDAIYLIAGTYSSDMHYSLLYLPSCVAHARLSARALKAVEDYHRAFESKCGGILVGDSIRGRFSGSFVQEQRDISGTSIDENIFVVRDIDSIDISPERISCPPAASKAPNKSFKPNPLRGSA